MALPAAVQRRTREVCDNFNFDAAESAFIERELESVRTGLYQVKYGPLQARGLVPVSNEDDPGAETIKFNVYDGVGLAKVVSSYAKDFPRADVKVTEQRVPVRSLGASYGYNIQEMRAAALAKKPLDAMKAYRARLAVEEKLERIALLGDSANGLNGLFGIPNAQTYTPATGASGGITWGNASGVGAANKTPDEILADLNGVWSKIVTTTNGLERPDSIGLPLAQYNVITAKARSGTSDTTILNYFLANNPDVKRVVAIPRLSTAGAGSSTRMICWRSTPDCMQLAVPQEFEQFPPQLEGMEFKVPCHMRTGGVIVFYPLAVCYADGI